MSRIDTAIVVGAGGTGSHLLEPLARLLAYHPRGPRGNHPLLVVDGDRFEPSNGARQLHATPGESKATVLATVCRAVLPGSMAIPVYVDGAMFRELVLAGLPDVRQRALLVVLAVDNNATRREILQALDASGVGTFLALSPANDLAHGNLLAWARRDGTDVCRYPLGADAAGRPYYPELRDPADRMPGGGAKLAPSTPQLIVANAWAAALTLAAVRAWLDGLPLPDRTEFNCTGFKIRPLTPDGTARADAFAVQPCAVQP